MSAIRYVPRRPSKQLVPLVLYNAHLLKVAHITQQVGIYHQFHSAGASPSPYNCADSSSAKTRECHTHEMYELVHSLRDTPAQVSQLYTSPRRFATGWRHCYYSFADPVAPEPPGASPALAAALSALQNQLK